MFFTADLLSRRDSGFGLLWLAATLGSRSSFRKLPRRSVATADIPELCGLIAEPPEPLALRLSSNLMIGVARVYKVKQEILFTDVTTCFNTLKKAVSELHASSNVAAQLQMGQPSVRPDTVTVVIDPGAAFTIDFDHLFTAWDEARIEEEEEDDSDEEYGTQRGPKARKAKEAPVSAIGQPRGESHTLKENHDLILSASFDNSFRNEGFGGIAPSSSQFGGFGFDDDFLGGLDNAGDIGDELAKELGEGWGAPMPTTDGLDGDMAMLNEPVPDFEFETGVGDQDIQPPASPNREDFLGQINEVGGADDGFMRGDGSVIVPLSPVNAGQEDQAGPAKKKTKRVRLLLDARTELTNEELQRARTHYLEEQAALRREIIQKKADKESEKVLEDMILGVPRGLHAPVLVDFWLENFRLRVEARSGKLHIDSEGEPPRKRRRIDEETDAAVREDNLAQDLMDIDNPYGMDNGLDLGMPDIQGNDYAMDLRMRSSEEPGQARRDSRPPSAIGASQFGIEPFTQISASQRSAVFPWDNAGVSSSVGGAFDFPGSDRISLPNRGRGSSLSSRARNSPMHLGLAEEFGRENPFDSDGFEFAVPEDRVLHDDSQKTDVNAIALERNSLNFLEYAKMQLNAMAVPTASLPFDDVVPKTTSTPHVAAAAFYHCLVLATKNLIDVTQEEIFGPVNITVK